MVEGLGRKVGLEGPTPQFRGAGGAKSVIGPYHRGMAHPKESVSTSESSAEDPLKRLLPGRFIVLDIRANAFLHHMVRNIAGVLMQIGCGEQPVEWAQQVLEVRDRAQGGLTAPAYGLYLVDVTYPETFALPERYLGPHFLSALPDVAN